MRANQRIAVLALLLFASAVLAPATPGLAADGKEIFLAQKCNLCHGVSSAGIVATTTSEKMKGPDLKGKVAERGVEWTTKYLKKEVDNNDKKHGKELKLTPEETKTLVDWLAAQK